MKNKYFGVLQRMGRSFMLPLAVLPVAGLLLGLGSSFTNETMIEAYGLNSVLGKGTVLYGLLIVMQKAGEVLFDNLPIIFAVGIAIGMAKHEKEVAALAAVIAYFSMNASVNALLVATGAILENEIIAQDILAGTITTSVGIQTLQMGVFGGIITGMGVGALHNRFHRIKVPNALSFFGGSRFVPIIVFWGKPFCTDYQCDCICIRRNFDVFCLAADSKGDLLSGRISDRNRISRDLNFWTGETIPGTIWTTSCILPSILADCRRRSDGNFWEIGDGWAKYLLCTACRSVDAAF